jgi:hypothetical protein
MPVAAGSAKRPGMAKTGLSTSEGGSGSPCEKPCGCDSTDAEPPEATVDPVYLFNGSVTESAVDLVVSGPGFSWKQYRTYDSANPGQTQLGGKWISGNGDLRLVDVQGSNQVSLLATASSQRLFTEDPETGELTAQADSTLTMEYDEQAGEYVMTDWNSGAVHVFHDFLTSSYQGRLKESTTLSWKAAGKDGTLYSYDANGLLSQITTPEGQDYNIVFTFSNGRMTRIEVRTGALTSTRVQEVDYTYFDSQTHSADLGADGDLVQVRRATLKTGGDPDTAADWTVRYIQYRYFSTHGQLKSVFESDEVARLVAERADISDADDILALDDDDDNSSGQASHTIKDYASSRFTYYTTDVKTCYTGVGTTEDPKCVTVWAAGGEDLNTIYGGTNVDETANNRPMVRSGTSAATQVPDFSVHIAASPLRSTTPRTNSNAPPRNTALAVKKHHNPPAKLLY